MRVPVPTSVWTIGLGIVTSRTEFRPRAVWRVLLPLLAVFVPGIVGVMLIVDVFVAEAFQHVQTALFTLLTALVLIGSARWLDRRSLGEYGFNVTRAWWLEFGVGALLGIAINAFVFGVALGFGWATITEWRVAGETFGFAVGISLALVGYALVGFWEETLFRGILLTNTAEGLAARGTSDRVALVSAITITTLLFAVLHLNQVPSIETLPLLFTVLVLTGGLLAVAYVATDSLALPIGLHFTVNFASTSLFGLRGEWGMTLPSVARLETTAPESVVPIEGTLAGSWIYVVAVLLGYLFLVGWLVTRNDLSFERSIVKKPESESGVDSR